MDKTTTIYQIKSVLLYVLLAFTGLTPAFGQLTISKEAPDSVKPGDELRFRIVYQNTGSTPQTNVVIEDVLPSTDFTYLYSNPEGIYDPLTNTIKWDKTKIDRLEELNEGLNIIHVYGIVGKKFNDASHYPDGYYLSSQTEDFYNSATIKSDQVTTPVVSNTTKSSSKQVCTATLSQASGVIKSSSSSELFYLVSITNTGNIWNKWTLSTTQAPAPYQQLLASFTDLTGLPLDNNSTQWLAPGATTMFLMKLVSPTGTNPSIGTPKDPNMTTVIATPVACGSPVSREFVTDICGGQCPPYMYVSAYKLDIPDPVQAGTNLTYKIIIYNSSGAAVPNITLTELYPSQTTLVSVSPPVNSGSTVPYTLTGNNVWTFASLPAGMTTIDVVVSVPTNIVPNTTIENRIELTTPDAGTLPFNFYIQKTLVLSTHNLWIEKTADKTHVQAGDLVNYTLTFGNKGNYKGDNVTITDNYDEIYMDVIDAGGGTFANGNIEWTISGDMMPGASYTRSYTLQVKPGATFPAGTTNLYNIAYIANHQNPLISFDSDYNDNQSHYHVFVVNLPDLVVQKSADKNPVKPGENLKYTITVTNSGDADHTGSNYSVVDKLPTGVTYVSSTPAGIYNSTDRTVTWTMTTDLAIGATQTFEVEVNGIAQSLGGTDITNEVSVESVGLLEKDTENNVFSLKTRVLENLWYGGVSTDWSDGTNWTYGHAPASGEDVIFATTGNYIAEAERDLILDIDRTIGDLVNESSKALVIPIHRTLLVDGKATTNSEDRIVLKSNKNKATGALIFNQPLQNASVTATVEFASISKPSTGTWPRSWQFFGVPVVGKRLYQLFGPNVQGSIYGGDASVNTIIRKYEEFFVDPSSAQEKWTNVNYTDIMVPYWGYEITQPQTVFDNADTNPYKLKGTLVTQESLTIPFNISQSPVYSRGNYMLSNPYAAPIFISNMQAADFNNLAQTVYIYNSGSRQDWLSNNGATQAGDLPGTYTAIPINTATTMGKTQIPSMQAFMLKALTDNPATASFRFEYSSIYRPLTLPVLDFPNEPMRIAGKENVQAEQSTTNQEIKPMITMDVIGENSSDRVYLITAENTTKVYDAGWDGSKSLASDIVQLYVMDPDNRRLQVNSDFDLNETYLGFRTGGESVYTLKFRYNNQMSGVYESLYIQDLATGVTSEITDGMSMNFISASGAAEKRFKLTAAKIRSNIGTLNTTDAIGLAVNSSSIIVENKTGQDVVVKVYNLVGQPLLVKTVADGLQTLRHELPQGTYIVEAQSADRADKTILKSMIKK